MPPRLDLSDVYSPAYRQELHDFKHYIGILLRQIFLRNFVASGRLAQHPAPWFADPANHPTPTAFHFTRRLFEYLADCGELSEVGGHWSPAPTLTDADPEDSNIEAYLNDHPHNRRMYDFLRGVRDVSPRMLFQGEDSLLTMVMDDFHKSMALWEDLMERASVKAPGHDVILRALKQLMASSPLPITVFEGGAGIGAALRFALQDPEFRALSKKIGHYAFTDISLSLIKLGRAWIRRHDPETLADRMTFKVVNLDKMELPEAFLQPQSVNAIVCENVLHDVTDFGYTLNKFHSMLKPGGSLIVTMAFRQRPRDFFMFEFMQSSFHSYFNAKLEPGFRETYGWLTAGDWERSLKRAGFSRIDFYPEEQDMPTWVFGGLVAWK
ncbi:MAG: class I SAM-dependent methyltransferase [Deltaproteobacteria bacterium]|nr:class I SAM-dependent methyltransferase [Deltaproteobacteria bacterium]